MTKEQALIERLADKTLSFGCKFLYKTPCCSKERLATYVSESRNYIYYHKSDHVSPNLLGASKENIKILGHPILIDRIFFLYPHLMLSDIHKLVLLWGSVGIGKSLQELTEDDNAKELFDFLDTLY